MSNPIYVQVKTLPPTLQSALEQCGYHRTDISVHVSETSHVSSHSGDGLRAFTALVNIETGATEIHEGSWGGANPFYSSPVDADTRSRPLPPDGAVINGHIGGGKPCWASLTVHPSRAAKLLPPAVETLSARNKTQLGVLCELNSKGRKEWFDRHPALRPSADDLTTLSTLQMIKVSKSGAVTITTDGRNNADRNAKENYMYSDRA